jgi:uncharacterized protein
MGKIFKRMATVALVLFFSAYVPQVVAETKMIGITTGPTGGAYYPMGGGIADIINLQKVGITVKVEITGGAKANCNLVGSGKSELGITNANLAFFAKEGKVEFDKKLNIAALGNLHPSILQIAVLQNANFNTVADLRGKKIGVGPAGSGAITIFKDLLSLWGMSFSDIRPSYLPYDQASDQLKDGQIDATVVLAGFPAAAISSLATTAKVQLLPFPSNKEAELAKKFPYYNPIDLPAGTYKGQEKEILVLAVFNVFIASSTMDNDMAYTITKTVYSNLQKLQTYHGAAKEISLKNAPQTPIPLHPGAARYFREIGLLK